ncbi:MAG: MMPL family transporter [Bacilli bacterium]|nr:MMPL family transporter [Bacilli bacterium]
MKKLSSAILKNRTSVIIVFLIATVISMFLVKEVKINYNLSDYLPKDSESLIAVEEMSKYYSSTVPNVKLMIPKVSIEEALSYKAAITKVKGVNQVLWVDDYANLSSLQLDESQLEDWYKDDEALFLININTDSSLKVVNEIKSVVKSDSRMAGDAINLAAAQSNVQNEMRKILLWIIPINILVLLFITSSWFEPLLFMITIGVAIVINMGTNIIFGEISSITQSAVAILQLAVSMDYAIFLLHRFAVFRHEGKNVEEAMRRSMRDSAPIIIASAATTILGFLALVMMKFKIGPDLGIVLAKGIVLSLISVLFLLPVLAVATHKIIDKTRHKSLMPSFNKMGKGIVKSRFAILIIVLLLVAPCFIAGQNNNFIYGSTGMNSEDSKVYQDAMIINKQFGINNQMVLLVPVGNYDKELKLIAELQDFDHVIAINSFVTLFGINTPIEYLPQEAVREFISEKYSRIIIKTDVDEEGQETFELVQNIRKLGAKYYNNSYHLTGISVINYDMKQTVTSDNLTVNIAAIISIILVLIITFKSLLTPFILIISIETAIWINLAITYLMGSTLNYMGFLIVSTVQLGATVDYAILFAKKYLIKRAKMDKKQASISTIEEVAPSIIGSATILAIAGLGLGLISTNGVISQLGTLVGRGAIISAVMVILFVPAMFILCDKIIEKRMLRRNNKR